MTKRYFRNLVIPMTILCVANVKAAETLTVSHGYPPNHVIAQQGITPWMECVAERTAGRIGFNYFPGGQIASVKDSLDAINGGLSQVSTVVVPYLSHKLPLNGITMLPDMGDTSTEMVSAYRELLNQGGPVSDEWDAIGVRPLVINMLPVFQMVSTVGAVDSLDAFSGVKIRSAGGLLNFTISALGAVPVEMPAGDMYVALQRGTLDAAFLALASVKPYSVDELANAVSVNGSFGGGATIIGIDNGVWERLSPEYQAAIDDCGAAVERQFAVYLDEENVALQKQFGAQGIDVYEFSNEDEAKIKSRLDSVALGYVERLSKRGLPSSEVYEQYRTILGQ